MSLDDYLKKSKEDRAKNSSWISTALGDEGAVVCDQYLGEELVKTDKGQQLVMTFLCDGKEMKLGRPYPFSLETEKFVNDLKVIAEAPPFIIRKKQGKKWAEYSVETPNL